MGLIDPKVTACRSRNRRVFPFALTRLNVAEVMFEPVLSIAPRKIAVPGGVAGGGGIFLISRSVKVKKVAVGGRIRRPGDESPHRCLPRAEAQRKGSIPTVVTIGGPNQRVTCRHARTRPAARPRGCGEDHLSVVADGTVFFYRNRRTAV